MTGHIPRFSGNAHDRRTKRRAWLRLNSGPPIVFKIVDNISEPAKRLQEAIEQMRAGSVVLIPQSSEYDIEYVEPRR